MGCFTIYVQSKNTMYYWDIHLEEYPTFKHYEIYHRHRDARNLKVVIEQIKDHDAFQLNGRKSIKKILVETV
jgi:hypothetical protein